MSKLAIAAPVQLVFGRLSALFAVVFRLAWPGRTPSLGAGARNRTDEAVAARRFSSSDKAKSCLTISAFSHLSARLGLPARFGTRANTAIASVANAIPIAAIEMPVIVQPSLAKMAHAFPQEALCAGRRGGIQVTKVAVLIDPGGAGISSSNLTSVSVKVARVEPEA